MFLNECCEDEVSIIIKDLQNGKSSDIPIGVIKKTSKIISPILASNFNCLMEIGKFPDELKLGKIKPIYKNDSDELLENYRPVSTLPIFGKYLRKLFTPDCITILYLSGFYMINNLDLESTTQQAMH